MLEHLGDNAFLIAVVGAIGIIAGHIINGRGRKEEVTAKKSDDLVVRLGQQVDRLEVAQMQDRRRIDWLEDELWGERTHSHKLHSGLSTTVPWGESMIVWADGDRNSPYPKPPDFPALRRLMETPRQRRPPPAAEPE